MGGTAVLLADYDPSWPEAFEAEEARLRAVFGDAIVRLHHAGSTSVPGLVAKPVIDVLLEASSLDQLDACRDRAEAAGYRWKGEYGLPRRRYLTSEEAPDGRGDWPMEFVHIHAWASGDPQIPRHLAFRDALRGSDGLVSEYGNLKRRLQAAHPADRAAYTDAKTEFIDEVVRQHGPPTRILVRAEPVRAVLERVGRDDAVHLLGPAERGRLHRTGPESRDAYLAGAALVRSCLSQVSGEPVDSWTFRRTPLGRPVVDSPRAARGVHFSLSHAGGRVACVVSGGVVCGIDVAAVEPVDEDGVLARATLTEAEGNAWRGLGAAERDQAFWQIWSCKEALTKALGRGLRSVLPHASFPVPPGDAPEPRLAAALGHVAEDWRFRLLEAPPGFVLGLAAGPGRGVRIQVDVETA